MFLAMAVVYVLLPFDLLPEVVFGVLGTYEYNFEYINWKSNPSNDWFLKPRHLFELLYCFLSGLLDDILVFVLILIYVAVVFRRVITQTGIGAE